VQLNSPSLRYVKMIGLGLLGALLVVLALAWASRYANPGA